MHANAQYSASIQFFQIMIRAQNAHSYVNAAFLLEHEDSATTHNFKRISSCSICYGGISPEFLHASATEEILKSTTDLYSNAGLRRAIESLNKELQPNMISTDASPEYRKNVAIALFYRFVLSTMPLPDSNLSPNLRSSAEPLQRGLSSGQQSFGTVPSNYPITQPVKKYEGQIQASGEAIYANDLRSSDCSQELWAAFVHATQIGMKISNIDASEALV